MPVEVSIKSESSSQLQLHFDRLSELSVFTWLNYHSERHWQKLLQTTFSAFSTSTWVDTGFRRHDGSWDGSILYRKT